MSPINGLSERRRLPRLGKIQLGIKVKTNTPCKCKEKTPNKKPRKDCRICEGTGFVFRPKEEDYFVCPPEVQAIYGKKPKELPIMFPVENEEVFFQQWYMRYAFGVLKCIGDGRNARTWDEQINGFKSVKCPCEELEKRNCSRQGILQFLLYEVPGAGVWQIRTGSKNSIIDINSSIDYIRSMCERIRMIPLVLKREEMTTPRSEEGKLKSSTHFTLKIDLANTTLKQLLEYARVKPSQILLPSADLEEDEQYYPPGGWPKEEKKKEPEKEAEKKDEVLNVQKAQEELKSLMGDYVKLGGKISMEEAERIGKFSNFQQYSAEIDRLQAEIEKIKSKSKSPGTLCSR